MQLGRDDIFFIVRSDAKAHKRMCPWPVERKLKRRPPPPQQKNVIEREYKEMKRKEITKKNEQKRNKKRKEKKRRENAKKIETGGGPP